MIRDALDRMTLGEHRVLAGVDVVRVSLFGFRVGAEVLTRGETSARLLGGPTWQEMTAGAWRVFAGRCAEVVRARPSSPPDETAGVDVAAGARDQERLRVGAATEARIAELRRVHGRALRVTGQARAKRARWTKAEAWLVVSYPRKAGTT
jgi:hypothetical protein